MKLQKLFFILTFICFNQVFPCDCPQLQRETMVSKGLKNAEIVFYGELVKIDTVSRKYSFRIIELFKGDYKSPIINGKSLNNNCEIFPFKKDLWIVYASFNKDNTISISYCLPSQTIEIPTGFLPPIPLFTSSERRTTKIDSLNNEIDNLKIRNETMSNWFYQLEQLRAYKLSQNKIPENQKNTIYNKTTIISLIINTLLFAVVFFMLARKRFFSNKQITK
ncbi:hypothetical protein [Flavobacterium restrictum]|uniref:Tissue inhibitor of metalloproteinase n=1 Tax=Flavobacterium restrictum TaxID=2594428 RepID=A0A553DXJ0_9FLAO|nr:hypothetical protein [Flavobacterium restrictum]TRX37499.1 hypothetical protein FNW21_11995 [Flavobacterium restrictum]